MNEQGSSIDQDGWQIRSGLALHELEEYLDWLDQQGCALREITIEQAGATIRWRWDPAVVNLTAQNAPALASPHSCKPAVDPLVP
jgi:hypothetical protein